jgi:hypothetical protein
MTGLMWLVAAAANAQTSVVDVNLLALDWARGRYLAPVICETAGELTRGGRRVMIMPGERRSLAPVARILFSDLEVPGATRCFDDLGAAQPNVIGQIQIRQPDRSRPDTAQRDFKAALRRDKGFDFEIVAGILRFQTVGEAGIRNVDFRGGRARLHEIVPGSDQARLLGDLRGLRKLLLEIEARDGTHLTLPLVMTDLR